MVGVSRILNSRQSMAEHDVEGIKHVGDISCGFPEITYVFLWCWYFIGGLSE